MTAEVLNLWMADDSWFNADKQVLWVRDPRRPQISGDLWQRVAEGKRRD